MVLHSYDGYTTNITLEDFGREGTLLAHHWQGEPLSREHGGPLRLIVPHLYFWKSAKWLFADRIHECGQPGIGKSRLSQSRRSLDEAALFGRSVISNPVSLAISRARSIRRGRAIRWR